MLAIEPEAMPMTQTMTQTMTRTMAPGTVRWGTQPGAAVHGNLPR